MVPLRLPQIMGYLRAGDCWFQRSAAGGIAGCSPGRSGAIAPSRPGRDRQPGCTSGAGAAAQPAQRAAGEAGAAGPDPGRGAYGTGHFSAAVAPFQRGAARCARRGKPVPRERKGKSCACHERSPACSWLRGWPPAPPPLQYPPGPTPSPPTSPSRPLPCPPGCGSRLACASRPIPARTSSTRSPRSPATRPATRPSSGCRSARAAASTSS